MSSDSDPDLAQEILDAYGRLVVENYCIIASSVVLFADSIFTLTDEVQRIWGRRFTGATLIFLLTRWVAVAERIVLVTSVVLPTIQDKYAALATYSLFEPAMCSCVPVLRLDDTLTDISYLMFGAFMVLRVRGVWGRNWVPVIAIALLTPIRPIISLYTQIHYTPIAFGEPLYGCGAVFDIDSATYTKCEDLGIASKATSLGMDTAVLLLTWYKTYAIKQHSRRLGVDTPYITLLLRDGTLYFSIILLVQILGIVSISVGSNFPVFIVWPYFDQVFTVIFLTRFMLNLRGVYLSDTTTHASTASTSRFGTPHSAIRFSSSVVGNMGAPLSFGSATLTSYSTTPTIHDRREEHDTILETEWDLKDETLETSRDPLSAGLRKDREDTFNFGLELQAGLPSPSEAEVTI
ncbi:hypothetical protein C8Q74DRAFT_1372429 [Fomes fomentarius]|nr:hypothetical protein C8Q74DRAFT_1372429 [Fomes fomentarius]